MTSTQLCRVVLVCCPVAYTGRSAYCLIDLICSMAASTVNAADSIGIEVSFDDDD